MNWTRLRGTYNRRKEIILFLRKIVLTTLAGTLSFSAQAQTRRTRRTTTPPTSVPAAPRTSNANSATAATGINITATDMSLIIDGSLGLLPEDRARLSANPEERKDFARNIRRTLAAAEEAKAAGYLARPELKLKTELSRAFVIAEAYFKQREDAGVTDPEKVVTAAEVDAFFNELATGPEFEAFLRDYSKNSGRFGAPISEKTRKELRYNYGRVMVGMRKGITAGLDRDRSTQLTVMLQQAKLLAGAYAQEMKAHFQPTAAEIDAYIAANPDYDTKAERAKIEAILQRVRAGEDFAKLADEFTEDPGGKGKGGDLGWFGRGAMVKAFEDAAFGLKPGEVSGVLETPFGFHIIKLDNRRAQGASAEVHARHILIEYKSTGRRPVSPMFPRDKAKAALQDEKLDRTLDEAAVRRHIQVAEDFAVGTGK